MKQRFLGFTLAALLAGCSISFQETHYFKSGTASPSAVPNYYRLTVQGRAVVSSARYISGYFDEDTINTYFNEYTQPAGAAIYPPTRPAATGEAQPVAKGLQDKKLIMILSSNSDEVANQIGALAASKQFTASLAGLMARDQYKLAYDTEQRLSVDRGLAKKIAEVGDQLLKQIPADAPPDQTQQLLLEFINLLAADLGYEGAFANLESAAQWLNFNRARLSRGDR